MDRNVKKPRRATYKTYTHLAHNQKIPTAYEIATTSLLYYPGRGYEVETPVSRWCAAAEKKNPITITDWQSFADPRAYTYTTYVQERRAQELYLTSILDSAKLEVARLKPQDPFLQTLESLLIPIIYPLHGFQMVAAFVGQMAPNSRVAICCALQAADEMRKLQHVAFLAGLVREKIPTFANHRQKTWEHDPLWQPARKCMEELLVTYSWVEALVGLNCYLKPTLTEALFTNLSTQADSRALPSISFFLKAFADQDKWHAEWSQHLFAIIAKQNSGNESALDQMHSLWRTRTENILPIPSEVFDLREAA